ncbi:MAG: site-specific DNA-methyltransferase [Myxococcales bacterium]|nr:site-specific DNA-methyltransferase [Myxococcales bacterium]
MIHHADVLDALRAMPDNSFHGCLTDPPYGLSFMGHQWDHGVPSAEVWREVLRVLRPGAALLAFGGTRTSHRLTCAIEDAGFEIRDCMMWLYGSGFPKSHDVSKAIDREAGAVREVVGQKWAERYPNGPGGNTFSVAEESDGSRTAERTTITAPATEAARQWEGHGTALKPAWEPIIVARKPLDGTVAQNVQRWGCGALAIDASRVGTGDALVRPAVMRAKQNALGAGLGAGTQAEPLGRWPANVILDEEAGAVLDAQSGTLQARGNKTPSTSKELLAPSMASTACVIRPGTTGTTRGASRFFYCAKASRKERDAGLEGFELAPNGQQYGTIQNTPNPAMRNVHPTVKPIALATYLARLILPPVEGARLLVPFCGSGSEMLGGTRAGWAHVEGIDSWDVAVKIARARTA